MSHTVTNATGTSVTSVTVRIVDVAGLGAIRAAQKIDRAIDWAKEDAKHPLAKSRVKQGGLAAGIFGAGAIIGALIG